MSVSAHPSGTQAEAAFSHQFLESPRAAYGVSFSKRKRGDFEMNLERSVDVVEKGLISRDDASIYFSAFFQGCVSLLIAKKR